MKRFKILLATLLMVVAVVTVTSVSYAAWIFADNAEQSPIVDSGVWDGESTNTYNLRYEAIKGVDEQILGYRVVGFIDPMVGTMVRIPSTYNNLPVIAIGSSFCQNEQILVYKLVIPSSVKTIESDALCDLSMLTTLIIEGNGLTTIGDRVLTRCQSLINVVLPSSITAIGSDVLTACLSLTKIDVRAVKANINAGAEIVNFGLKTDNSLPTIVFGGEVA